MIAPGGSSSDREVLFRLKISPDERAASTLAAFGKRIADSEKTVQEKVRSEVRATEKEKERAAKESERSAKRVSDMEEREAERLHQRHRERQRSIASQNRQRREEEAKEAQRAARETERLAKKTADAEEREAERVHRRHRQRQRQLILDARERAAEEAKAIAASRQQAETGVARAGYAGRSLIGSGVEFVRGAAYLGLAGENDSQAMLQTVAKIEGAAAMVRGGLDVYSSAAEGLQGLKDAISGPGGVRAAMALLASGGLTAAAGLAAIASIAVAGNMVYEVATGNVTNDGFTARMGRMRESWYRNTNGVFGMEGSDYTDAYHAEQRANRMEVERAIQRGNREREFVYKYGLDRNARGFAGESFERGIRADMYAGRMTGSAGLSTIIGRHTAEFASASERTATLTGGGEVNEMAAASLEEQYNIGKRLVELSEERVAKAREEAAVRIGAAREDVTKTQEALRLQEQIVDTMQSRLASSAERFGNLSDEQKIRAKQAFERLKAGDFDAVSKEDRSLVRSLGLQGTDDAAIKASTAEAERFGFSTAFGAEERAKLESAKSARDELQRQLTAKQDVVVKLEVNEKAIEQAFMKARDGFIEQMEAIAKRVFEVGQDNQRRDASTIGQSPQLQSIARIRP